MIFPLQIQCVCVSVCVSALFKLFIIFVRMLVEIFFLAMQSNVISTRSRKVRMHKLNELNFFPAIAYL